MADTVAERDKLEIALDALGLLGGKSFANFVLLRSEQSNEILQALENRGIIPRPLVGYGMADYLRISVGTAEENALFLSALHVILGEL